MSKRNSCAHLPRVPQEHGACPRLWREGIPKQFWTAVDLVQDLFIQSYHGNIRAEGTVSILQGANAKMENMAGKNVSRYLGAEKVFDGALDRAAKQGYIIQD